MSFAAKVERIFEKSFSEKVNETLDMQKYSISDLKHDALWFAGQAAGMTVEEFAEWYKKRYGEEYLLERFGRNGVAHGGLTADIG